MRTMCIRIGVALCCMSSLIHAQSISGTVKDALLDAPIEGAVVSIVQLKQTFITDAGGAFATETLKPGVYTVRTEAKDYLKHSQRIFLTSEQGVGQSRTNLEIKLYNISSNVNESGAGLAVDYFFPGHGHVSIVIYDNEGNKIRNAFDRSRQGGKRSFTWDGKDNAGRYVPAGAYTCRIASGTMVMNRALEWKGPKDVKQ